MIKIKNQTLKIKSRQIMLLVLFIVSYGAFELNAQVKFGSNPNSINANSLLELESNNKGILFPRVSLTGTNSVSPLSAHVAGMIVYNIATAGSGGTAVAPGYYYNTGTSWMRVSTIGAISLLSNVSPSGSVLGDLQYNTNASSGLPVGLVLWNGSKWISLDPKGIPNISLTTSSLPAGSSTNQLAYNTSGVAPTGMVYWDGSKWQSIISNDQVIGNEVTNATTDMGLLRSGSGTTSDPYTLGFNAGSSVNQTMVWDGSKWIVGSGSLVNTSFTNNTTPAGSTIGQLAYNTNAAGGNPVGPVYWNGTNWLTIDNATGKWNVTGNSGTSAGANFLGTTDAKGLIFKTDNTERMQITSTGNVGIGTNTPSTKLHVVKGTNAYALKIVDGTQGNNKVFTSDANGVGSWDMPDVYKSTVLGTVISNNTISNSNSGGYIYSGIYLTLTKGKWIVSAGLTFTNVANDFWLHAKLSSSSSNFQLTGFSFIGPAGSNTCYAGSLVGSYYNTSFISGANIVDVTSNNLTLYLMIENPSTSSVSFNYTTNSPGNYLVAVPIQ